MLIIYADILFFINVIMDALVLYVCSKVMNLPTKKYRIFASACIGGLYGVADIFINFPEPAVAIAVSVLMCVTAFGFIGKFTLVKTLIMFYCAGFLAGGIISFLFNAFFTYRNTKFFSRGLTPGIFILFAAIAFVIITVAEKFLSVIRSEKKVWVEISLMGKSKKFCLLCDTGNLLRDPYSGLPVIVISKENILEVFDVENYIKYFSESKTDSAVKLKIRYILVKTATGKTVLPAFVPDKIIIKDAKGASLEIKAVVAVMPEMLENTECDGIIPYSLTQGL